jgi:hypothetical protein
MASRAPRGKTASSKASQLAAGLNAQRSFVEVAKVAAALAIVPLLIESGRSVKANLSLDAWLLAAIDEAAAAREKIAQEG